MAAAEDSSEAQGASRAVSWLCRAHTSMTLTTCSLSTRSASSAWASPAVILIAALLQAIKKIFVGPVALLQMTASRRQMPKEL